MARTKRRLVDIDEHNEKVGKALKANREAIQREMARKPSSVPTTPVKAEIILFKRISNFFSQLWRKENGKQ